MSKIKSESPGKFKIGLIQISISNNPHDNLNKAIDWIERAAKKGAKVICLPELFKSHYFCQKEDTDNFNLAESIPGPSTDAISKVCKKLGVVVVASLFEKRASGIYHNTTAVINDEGKVEGIYRKMHIPDDPAYYEKFYFTPGDLGYKSFKTKFGKISTLICWDQWYPEAARLTAMQDPTVIFYPTAIGWHPNEKKVHGKAQFEAWQTVQRGHAIANGIYVAAVNRIGSEKPDKHSAGIEFWGSSFIANPQGVIITQASAKKEEILIAEVDLDRIEYIRRHWPFLRDRRIDTYTGITKRFLD
jgi:N-carbamoylputrescine amidase